MADFNPNTAETQRTEASPSIGILDVPEEHLTPGMKQYQDVKRTHPDCLVMLRMGDFYEMFYQDAITASRELEITLTARGKGEKRAPLAGIPFHALDNYLGRLVKKGHKVAIVEQLEDPKLAKGLVKRGLVRIITPGTLIESNLLDEKENNFLMAITCAGEEYSFAICDLSTGEFTTSTLEGPAALFSEIARHKPSECILPESLLINQDLVNKIKSYGCFVNTLADYFFSQEKARQVLQSHFQLQRLDAFGLEDQPKSIAVCGALLQYLHETQQNEKSNPRNQLCHVCKIAVQSSQHTMLVDGSTLRNLELISNIRDGTSRGTLLSIFDKTSTAMGSRLLRQWIKKPFLDRMVIEDRLDAITELNQSVLLREEVASLIENIHDLERLIGRINLGSATPRDLLSLKQSLRQLPLVIQKMGNSRTRLLQQISRLPDLTAIAKLLEQAIKEEAPLTIREGRIIKLGFNPELDQLQAIKTNSKSYLQNLEEQEKQKTGIPTLKIGYTSVFGYFIEVTKKNLSLVPSYYIRRQTTANAERYVTEELKIEEEKILGAEEKINSLEYELFQQILAQIAAQTLEIQDAARNIALLDVLCSLARVAQEYNYCRPRFIDEPGLLIRNGRHPVIEQLEERFIANDVQLNPGEMVIITGPNMAGKSTIMRQTALIVLLAQIGSYVPADEVTMGIVDRIFTRVGAVDDLSSGQSTFMVEMSETAAILHSATERSLIILDEIGRGTSTFDGVSIAWSVAEYIHNHLKAKTLFATHYHVLNKLAEQFSRVKNFNIAVHEEKGEVVFLHKLVPGGTDESYGVHVAKLAGLPDVVVNRAREIQEILQKDDDMVRKMKAKKLEEQMSLARFK